MRAGSTIDRAGAACGLASLATGAAGGALERGWPSAADPEAVHAFVGAHREAILAQSMLFLLSSALFLGFVTALAAAHRRRDERDASLSTIVLVAGAIWSTLGMVAQAFQVGATMAGDRTDPGMLWTMAALFSIANLPLAVMLSANAAATFRARTFPIALGWVSIATAAAQLVLWLGAFVRSGPLAPDGWLTYVLYPTFAVWLLPTALTMARRQSGAVAASPSGALPPSAPASSTAS